VTLLPDRPCDKDPCVTERSPLLTPYTGPHLRLPNRLAMSPMTRYRADPVTGVPRPEIAVYYAQRASAGLIITEGIWPTRQGIGGPGVPGLADDAQRAGWQPVTSAVHAAGGRIFAQLWHVGRLAHPAALPDGCWPVAPSAVRAPGTVHIGDSSLETVTPRAMTRAGIAATIESFAAAARRAVDAGFDGVELHGANGYLIHQFLADNTNQRTDSYGGSDANHRRFALELVDAVAGAIGPDRLGVKLSPANPENGLVEERPAERYQVLVSELDRLGLAYLHLSEKASYPAHADLRGCWSGMLIGNYDPPEPSGQARGEALLATGNADVVAYGRLFISNPDLPARFAIGAPLSPIDPAHLYRGGPRGYTDYPALDARTATNPVRSGAGHSAQRG
jgi:N-ethylmaleimide reductase